MEKENKGIYKRGAVITDAVIQRSRDLAERMIAQSKAKKGQVEETPRPQRPEQPEVAESPVPTQDMFEAEQAPPVVFGTMAAAGPDMPKLILNEKGELVSEGYANI